MPRAKYVKPPGPLPAIDKIQRSTFQFREKQRRELSKLLPNRLTEIRIPRDAAGRDWRVLSEMALPETIESIADFLVQATEHFINSHLTVTSLISESRMNAANVRAAIHRLRTALKPFVNGWVDSETASIVPKDICDKLAAREQEIGTKRFPGMKQRELAMLCQHIALFVKRWGDVNNASASEQDVLRFVDAALTFARVKHPNIRKHRDRLAVLVFPKNTLPHSEG